jgi:glyoxylase I family protein
VGESLDESLGESLDDSWWSVIGLHHVRIPVVDAWRSRDWYSAVLGFVSVLDFEEELGPIGVVLQHPTGLVIGLHADRHRASELAGFAILSLAIEDRLQLERLARRLDQIGISHGPIEEGHLGPYLEVPDPDGILVRFHAGLEPYAEEA